MARARRRDIFGWVIVAAIAAAAAVQLAAYWPGIMIYDAIRQYGQALSGRFDDWHPPAFEALWRLFVRIHTGPAPMLVLQALLYWGGYGLLSGWALQQGRRMLAGAIFVCALLPIAFALIGAVLKDSLMAGALLTATGLLALSLRAPARSWPLRIVAIALLLFAATLRFNAFLAGLPLLVAMLPVALRRTRPRLVTTTIVAAIPLLMAVPVANRLLHAERSGVELSLIIYDLGGITRFSGVDVFPAQSVADPVAVNRGCYARDKWDRYAWWGEHPCPIGFDSVRASLKASGLSPYQLWIGAMMSHPIAYAEHRLGHFNVNSRFLVRSDPAMPVPDQSDPNDWHYQVRPNALHMAVDRAVAWSARTPLGWPIWWMAVALAVSIVAPKLPSRAVILPLALSAGLYGLGYLAVSVASEMRYHLWTMVGALLALVIAGADVMGGAKVGWRRWLLAAAPVMLVTVLCIVWRGMVQP